MAPPLPGPPRLGAASTSEFISITWDAPTFNFSDLFYIIYANTTNISGAMDQFSGTVSTYTIWLEILVRIIFI